MADVAVILGRADRQLAHGHLEQRHQVVRHGLVHHDHLCTLIALARQAAGEERQHAFGAQALLLCNTAVFRNNVTYATALHPALTQYRRREWNTLTAVQRCPW